jgi:uncharacterized protein YecE (DUF72 family)
MPPSRAIIVGTAGWSIPAENRDAFPAGGSALERYAQQFGGVEINSSFHRRHRPSTWARWAESVPPDFQFSVKLPKEISHVRKLVDCDGLVTAFFEEVAALAEKLAVVLLQLPPRLSFDPAVAQPFLAMLLRQSPARVVCEPRHPSWFVPAPDAVLDKLGIARVAADPAPAPAAARPGGWRGLSYWRLHGSPHVYRSAYAPDRLPGYADSLRADHATERPAWCIFDNTAGSAAIGDALALSALL